MPNPWVPRGCYRVRQGFPGVSIDPANGGYVGTCRWPSLAASQFFDVLMCSHPNGWYQSSRWTPLVPLRRELATGAFQLWAEGTNRTMYTSKSADTLRATTT